MSAADCFQPATASVDMSACHVSTRAQPSNLQVIFSGLYSFNKHLGFVLRQGLQTLSGIQSEVSIPLSTVTFVENHEDRIDRRLLGHTRFGNANLGCDTRLACCKQWLRCYTGRLLLLLLNSILERRESPFETVQACFCR